MRILEILAMRMSRLLVVISGESLGLFGRKEISITGHGNTVMLSVVLPYIVLRVLSFLMFIGVSVIAGRCFSRIFGLLRLALLPKVIMRLRDFSGEMGDSLLGER